MSVEINDHRALGARLDLFHLQPEAPGAVFWHPRGFALFRRLEARLRQLLDAQGYQEVRSPQVLDQSIWERSGHWQNFRADMLVLEGAGAALKPVSCPGHIQLVQQMRPSHRQLPIRLAEFGLVHRNEPSGALQGLFRLRQFSQDDGHIFCDEAQLVPEVIRFCRSLEGFYRAFGFEAPEVALSGRPAVRAGSDELWERAESALEEAARAAGLKPQLQPGQGAFYGPKLEFALRDSVGRAWQCGTIQLDFVLPERFDLAYVDASGARRRPVMLHRAVLGSLERFLAILLEHHEGVLPPWLREEQVRVLLLESGSVAEAEAFVDELRRSRVRASLDARPLALGEKIADAHAADVPFTIAWGAREREGRVRLRPQHGRARELARAEAVASLAASCAEPAIE